MLLIYEGILTLTLADLINIGIETLVRDRYGLPAFDTLEREARAQRAATNRELFAQVGRVSITIQKFPPINIEYFPVARANQGF